MDKKKKKEDKPDARYVSPAVKLKLWAKSAGRCQICNENLLIDNFTYSELNNAHIAHIIDVNPKTHRYKDDPDIEKNELPNLMLLCQKHHRLIDNEEEKHYTIERLTNIKKAHEFRILNLTSIKENVKTNVLFYLGKIGKYQPTIDFEEIRKVLSDQKLFPSSEPITIKINTVIEDNEELYWTIEERNLIESFEKKIINIFENSTVKHFSCFALAPQPLLIRLGTLIPDLYTVDVFQKHREPDTWEWQSDEKDFEGFQVIEPESVDGIPVLNISLSATVDNNRITNVIDGELSIWTLTIPNPNNNFLTHQDTLRQYREVLRYQFNRIKEVHGHDTMLKVFPCMPNSASIEFGRVWMPKADLSLEVYDERDGFKKAITIKRN